MEGLKNYQITRTILLPAATIGYWKINALPAGNRPEITVPIFCYMVWLHSNSAKYFSSGSTGLSYIIFLGQPGL